MRNNREITLPAKLQFAKESDNRKDPYHTLVVAIFAQAVKDSLSKAKDPKAAKNRKDAKNWLKSRAFEEFCSNFLDYDDAKIADIRQALGFER